MSTCDTFTLIVKPPENDWGVIANFNWTTGDVVAVDLTDYVANPVVGTVYSLYTGALPLDLSEVSEAGLFSGTIAESQGGKFFPVFRAVTPAGVVTYSQLTISVVALEITAPILENIADVGNVQLGGNVSVDCNTGLTTDGNLNGTEPLVWSLDATSDTITGCDINVSTGVYEGTVDAGETIELKSIVPKVTNSVPLSDTDTFTVNIIAAGGVVPLMAALYSGNLECDNAVAPTWLAMPTFSWPVGTVVNLDLHDYLASTGGSGVTIDEFLIDSGALPTSLAFSTTLGTITGTIITGDIGTFAPIFTAENSSALVSAASEDMDITVAAVAAPTILSISATEGSSNIYIQYSEAMETTANDAASYNLGWTLLVNTVAASFNYVSGGTGARHTFVTDVTLYGDNLIQLVFDKDAS